MSFNIGLSGLRAATKDLNVTGNNIANAGTAGFKQSRAEFADLYASSMLGTGKNPQGSGVLLGDISQQFNQGNINYTQNAMDLAINGNGFFQVQMPDGTLAYTRDGNFRINQHGQLVTSSGYAVQPAITVPQNAKSLTVGKDGVVTITTAGTTNNTQVGTFQLASFINPAGLRSMGENLYAETEASGTANLANPGSNGVGALNQNYVETSNVNVVEEMVNMIQTQRAYEINSKSVQTSDQMLEKLSQL